MNIVCCLNNSYLDSLKVLLYSLSDSQNEEIDFYLVHKNLDESEVKEVGKFCNVLDIKFNPICFPDDIYYKICEAHKDQGGWISFSKETFFRLFFADVLPKEVTKCLYLDSDIYVQKNISQFYKANNSDIIFTGIPDPAVNVERLSHLKDKYFNKIGVSPDGRSFINAGVLIINVSEMRKNDIFKSENMIALLKQYPGLNDQDIINKFFYDNKSVYDDARYNLNPAFFNYKDAYIIHYMQNKPWSDDDLNNNYNLLEAILKWRHSEKWVRRINNLLKNN